MIHEFQVFSFEPADTCKLWPFWDLIHHHTWSCACQPLWRMCSCPVSIGGEMLCARNQGVQSGSAACMCMQYKHCSLLLKLWSFSFSLQRKGQLWYHHSIQVMGLCTMRTREAIRSGCVPEVLITCWLYWWSATICGPTRNPGFQILSYC